MTLLACSGCGVDANTSRAGFGAQLSTDETRLKEAIQRGEVDTWVAAPRYVGQIPFIPIYRGDKPGETYSRSKLDLSSSSSWGYSLSERQVLLNMLRINDDGSEELVFAQTPYGFTAMTFLVPQPPRPKAEPKVAPHVEIVPGAGGEIATQVIVVPPRPLDTPPPTPPTEIAPHDPSAPYSEPQNIWALPALGHRLALGSAVVREQIEPLEGKPQWRYRGEIWLRDLETDRVFTHGSAELEPTSWQLARGPSPKLQVVMSDREGWPTRVDFIDLNTFEVRSTPTRSELKAQGVK